MFDLLIKNAWVLTMDESFTEYKNGYIAIKDGKIAEVGENKENLESREVIDANGNIVLPGFINTHTHAAMALLRGYGSDNPLKVWLEQYIWPVEGKFVSYEFVKDGTDIACYEMLRNGITCFVDMYFYENAV
ncbi:MAG TPA: S-adenosylhomocysteine deaminase, partial [Sulfurihydrogenibium sp.]|nr:S-adenosylhomocysteine deaminase [Sulfurihydrogenibium sp.]